MSVTAGLTELGTDRLTNTGPGKMQNALTIAAMSTGTGDYAMMVNGGVHSVTIAAHSHKGTYLTEETFTVIYADSAC